jgi:hypothetical protein
MGWLSGRLAGPVVILCALKLLVCQQRRLIGPLMLHSELLFIVELATFSGDASQIIT